MWYRKLSDSDENENLYCEYLSDENYFQTFYCAIKPAINVAKLFGLFPIDISRKQPQEIKFKWKNYRTVISTMFILCCAMTTLFNLKSQVEQGPLSASNIVGVLFFGICCTIAITFFNISQRFRRLMMFWTNIERIFLHEKYAMPITRWKLRKKIKIFLYTFLCFSFSEHLFYLIAEINKIVFEIEYCDISDYHPLKLFITRHLHFVISNLPFEYNDFIGIIVEYLNFSYTFLWSYLDLFIILLSIGISDLLERLVHRMECLQTVQLNENIWAELRMHHVCITDLIKAVNEVFGFAFMLACCNDGYFILIQMLNITTSLPFLLSKIYFWYSLVFLITRSVLMVSFAANVYEYSRKPLEVIRKIPTDLWCSEIQRFFDQIKYNDNYALSGKNFFLITKRLLFSIAGILVTYELVLLQFDEKDVTWEDFIDCNQAA